MNYRMHIGVLLVLCLAYLTACMSGSRPPDPPHVAPPDPPACHAVCVTITDNEIASSRVTFLAGRAYSFVVTNQGKAANDFIIMTDPQGPNPGGPYNGILYLSSAIPPGARRSFTFAFPIIAPQSAVEFATSLAGPSGPGVLLPIQVELR